MKRRLEFYNNKKARRTIFLALKSMTSYKINVPWPFSIWWPRPTWKSRCCTHTVHHRGRGNTIIHVLLQLSKRQVYDLLRLAAWSLTSDWLIFSLSIIHCWQGDPVNSVRLCTIDRVTLSIAYPFFQCLVRTALRVLALAVGLCTCA